MSNTVASAQEREIPVALRCPSCGQELDRSGDEVACGSGHRFPVVRGIPRLYDDAAIAADQAATADAFGYSWTHYPKENPYTEEQWRDWVVPLGPEDFQGRLILDAGCGLAGFAEYALQWGADRVVGVDLSEAIDAAAERVDPRISLIQADLNRMPFPPRQFDVAYSIGVLHHTPDPGQAFQSVARQVKPGGRVFGWVYGRENNGWIVNFVDPLRKNVLSRLPRWVNKWLVSWPLALIVSLGVEVAKRRRDMPYGDYLRWLGERDFEFVHGVVFDHLVAPTAHYIPREEFEEWFRRAGLVDVEITWRNQNSWRGVGRVPEDAS